MKKSLLIGGLVLFLVGLVLVGGAFASGKLGVSNFQRNQVIHFSDNWDVNFSPSNPVVNQHQTITFTATILSSNAMDPQYSWYVDGQGQGGENEASFDYTFTESNQHQIRCHIRAFFFNSGYEEGDWTTIVTVNPNPTPTPTLSPLPRLTIGVSGTGGVSLPQTTTTHNMGDSVTISAYETSADWQFSYWQVNKDNQVTRPTTNPLSFTVTSDMSVQAVFVPVYGPTTQPTPIPTVEPTAPPITPTPVPTSQPTQQPTTNPTLHPTATPTPTPFYSFLIPVSVTYAILQVFFGVVLMFVVGLPCMYYGAKMRR